MKPKLETIYTIPTPYSTGNTFVIVYGELEMGWYEWRIETDGQITKDTRDQGYGSPEIALRDALIYCAPL